MFARFFLGFHVQLVIEVCLNILLNTLSSRLQFRMIETYRHTTKMLELISFLAHVVDFFSFLILFILTGMHFNYINKLHFRRKKKKQYFYLQQMKKLQIRIEPTLFEIVKQPIRPPDHYNY